MISRTRRKPGTKKSSKSEDFGINDDGISASFVDPDWDDYEGTVEGLRETYGNKHEAE